MSSTADFGYLGAYTCRYEKVASIKVLVLPLTYNFGQDIFSPVSGNNNSTYLEGTNAYLDLFTLSLT